MFEKCTSFKINVTWIDILLCDANTFIHLKYLFVSTFWGLCDIASKDKMMIKRKGKTEKHNSYLVCKSNVALF